MHKCHELAGSRVHLRGYSSFYARHLNNHYSGVVLIVQDEYYPSDFNRPFGRLVHSRLVEHEVRTSDDLCVRFGVSAHQRFPASRL